LGGVNRTIILGSDAASISVTTGDNNTIIASTTSTITGSTGSLSNHIYNSNTSNLFLTTGDYNGIIGSNNSNIIGTTGARNAISYSSGSRISGTTNSSNLIIGGSSNLIDFNGSGTNNIIIGSQSRITGTTTANQHTIVGGSGVWILETTGDYHSAFGNFGGTISGTNTNSQFLIGGRSTNVYNGSLQGQIGGTASTINGGLNTIGIGLSGRSITTPLSHTTYVENTYTYKTKSFGVVNAGSVSGSIDVDLSQGTLFYFTITGNTTPNFINWREGQQIQFWVDNDGSHTVPTATISGGGVVYAKAGTLNPTNNEITGYYGTIINGNLFLDEHLNFQAV
jgi:hypothetical protein